MRFRVLVAAASLALGMAPAAFAHTIAIGTENAGTPGSVTIWLGSYHTGAALEGSLTISGYGTQAFNFNQATKPSGLTLGTNLFYAPWSGGAQGQFDQSTISSNFSGSPVTIWQGVTFTGLTAGTHTYSITGMYTVNFSDWNSGQSNWTGTLTIPESSVTAVPLPSAAWMGLALLGGIGIASRLQKRRQGTPA